jgi:hypothetical protein
MGLPKALNEPEVIKRAEPLDAIIATQANNSDAGRLKLKRK